MTKVLIDMNKKQNSPEIAATFEDSIYQMYHWGLISQSMASQQLKISRHEFLNQLFKRKIPAVQCTPEELEEELKRL